MMSTPATTSTRGEFQNSLLGEIIEEQNTNTNLSDSYLYINSSISPVPSTRGEFLNSLLVETNNASTTINSYHQNTRWTEILVEDEQESDEIDRHEIKKAIQMMKREEQNPLDNWTDKFIRVNHKTYVPVEVAKDRNGRMIYTPLIPTEKPRISF